MRVVHVCNKVITFAEHFDNFPARCEKRAATQRRVDNQGTAF